MMELFARIQEKVTLPGILAYLRDRWVLWVVILVLSVPYYWDECWPYAPAIAEMSHHGISLSPAALDPELSRGHPLLFHALAAIWMRVFGPSHLAMHSFALYISLILLIALYDTVRKMFGKTAAIISLVSLVTQIVFFVQSSFVLMEVMLALWCLLAMRAYANGNHIQTTLWLAAAFFTKESGLVLGGVLLLHAFSALFIGRESLRQRTYRLLSVLVAFICIGVFFLAQHAVRGWYVYPMHTGMMVFEWQAFWYKFRMSSMRLLFYEQYKFYTYLLLVLLSLFAAIRTRNYQMAVIALPALILFYYVDDMRAGRILPSVPFFLVFLGAIGWFAHTYSQRGLWGNHVSGRMVTVTTFFILAFCAFSTLNFFTYRYLLSAVVAMSVLVGALYGLMIGQTREWVLYPVLVAFGITAFYAFKNDSDAGDCDPGAFEALKVQQGVVDRMEQWNAYDSVVSVGSALESLHLQKPTTGFLRGPRAFRKVQYDIVPATRYFITDNIEPDSRDSALRYDPQFRLADSVRVGSLWARIYRRN
jgi:4-amino-4-deoxy-L-arabinose transferase-like glycosyltransferase